MPQTLGLLYFFVIINKKAISVPTDLQETCWVIGIKLAEMPRHSDLPVCPSHNTLGTSHNNQGIWTHNHSGSAEYKHERKNTNAHSRSKPRILKMTAAVKCLANVIG